MSKWNDFLKEHRKQHPDKSYKQCMIDCKSLYHKQNETGLLEEIQKAVLNPDQFKKTVDQGKTLIKQLQEKDRHKLN